MKISLKLKNLFQERPSQEWQLHTDMTSHKTTFFKAHVKCIMVNSQNKRRKNTPIKLKWVSMLVKTFINKLLVFKLF